MRLRGITSQAAPADVLVAAGSLLVLCGLALRQPIWKDFAVEAQPAVAHLVSGDWHGFLAGSPVYAGSMLLRAPLFLLGYATDGFVGAYRLGAVACAAALTVLALVMAGELRRRGRPAGQRALYIVLIVANPVSVRALQMGHPEDLLAVALSLLGMLLALRGRGAAAGVALGVALASKQWAALVLPLALAASVPGTRRRLLLGAVLSAGALLAPFALASPAGFTTANRSSLGAPTFINAENVWRLFGAYHAQSFGIAGARARWDVADAFPAGWSHLLIVAVAVLVAAAGWVRRKHLEQGDWLLLVCGCGLLRGLLDPWNIVYYQALFVIALLVWEARAGRRTPLLSALALAGVWIPFQTLGTNAVGDGIRAALSTRVFCAWAIPAALTLLAWPLCRRTMPVRAHRRRLSVATASADS